MPAEKEVIKRRRSTGLYLPVEIRLNSGEAQSQQRRPLSASMEPGMFSHAANCLLDEGFRGRLSSAALDMHSSHF